jgi:hypothetical protein
MSLLDRVYDPESFRKSGHLLVDLLADNLRKIFHQYRKKSLIIFNRTKIMKTGRIKNLATRSNILKNSSATPSGYSIHDI